MHIPPLFHAEDLHKHVNAGSRNAESEPLHAVQTMSLKHPVQLLLQTKF